jgi:hypothetical protein
MQPGGMGMGMGGQQGGGMQQMVSMTGIVAR